MTPGYAEFEFDLPEALLSKLIARLSTLPSAALTSTNLHAVPEQQGVYLLLLGARLVYVGKTDAESGLHARLTRHLHKIQHRIGLRAGDVHFKAVRIFVFTALDLETQLIKHFRKNGEAGWNNSGFGSNDPGKERDTSAPGRFDLEYPIDIDLVLDIALPFQGPAHQILEKLKESVPYTFRFEAPQKGSKRPHADLEKVIETKDVQPPTARTILIDVVRQLAPGWQATKLPGSLIMYKEKHDFQHGEVLARS